VEDKIKNGRMLCKRRKLMLGSNRSRENTTKETMAL
jgi:hypothetical protein